MVAKGIVAPSLLSGDFAQLASECKRMLNYGADYLHMDIMDGHFVPNLTMGAPVISSVRKHLKKEEAYLDCHLMVSEPQKWVQDFAKAGASGYTFHWECSLGTSSESEHCQAAKSLIKEIKESGMRAGLSLKPSTPLNDILTCEIIPLLDMVLVMTVEPGFGGQAFMPECLEKVKSLRRAFPDLDIEVDGGLAPDTIELAVSAGANVIVAGSSIFKADDPQKVIQLFHGVLSNHGYESLKKK